MKTWHAVLAGLALGLASLGYALILYPHLPELIPIHWNIRGEVDGWAPKSWAIYLNPGIIAVLLLLLWGLPALSPRPFAVDTFRRTFNYVLVVTCGLMAHIHVVMLQAALHPRADSGRYLIGGLFLFFALLGNVLGKVRRNLWMGIRTPWTLASDVVWDRTHRLAAWMLTGAGVLGFFLTLLSVSPAFCLALLFVALLAPVFYSLLLYKQLEREDGL